MACLLTLQKLLLCLILCFVATEQALNYAVFGQRKEFGCVFETIYYKTKTTNTPIWEKQPSNGIYINSTIDPAAALSPTKIDVHPHHMLVGEAGKEQDNQDKVLDITEWNNFKSAVNHSFVLTLETHKLNDVQPFITFIKAYNDETVKRQREKKESISIESFLNEYDVPFVEKENPAGLIIEVIHEIQRRDIVPVKLGPASYLVSAYVDPLDLDVSNVKKGYEELTKTRFQDHVGGVIQIYYQNRLGYILLEPGYYNTYLITPFAVVLMADGNSPHGEFIFGRNLHDMTFTMGDPSNMYVVATYTNRKEVKNIVYYLGKSYCSFLESTTKGNLIRSEHGIVTFDSDGLGLGHFSSNIKVNWEFLLGQWRFQKGSSYAVLAAEDVLFKDLGRYRVHVLERYCKLLFLRPEQLGNRMEDLINTFFTNPQYGEMKNVLTTLSNTYNLDKRFVNYSYESMYTNATQRIAKLGSLVSQRFSKTFSNIDASQKMAKLGTFASQRFSKTFKTKPNQTGKD